MEDTLKLTKEQIKILKEVKYKIWEPNILALSNENKNYFEYFLDSLLAENYAGAAHIGYVFIEKYLRYELLRHNCKNIGSNEEYLNFLDREEKKLESGDDGVKDLISKQSELINKIRGFSFNDRTLQKDLLDELKSYTDEILSRKKYIRNQLSFNDICRQLREAGLLESKDVKLLKKFFSKYRNPLQHGLFKKLSEKYLDNKKISVVAGGDGGIRTLEINTSNLIMRETGMIKEILKDISIQLFNKIYELFEKLNTLKGKQ